MKPDKIQNEHDADAVQRKEWMKRWQNAAAKDKTARFTRAVDHVKIGELLLKCVE